ncbi:hypothetical protein AWB81_06216 [Caballeronia arationis]|uniref:Uncharacterized protein n=2 Tax=Caballeronia arationis TaxID=1777142 RepID=A0A7Z7N1T5_9BURK|nr:hypothetical protein [Caballeronia arationis]SAL02417.1 hypothetical protein AWB81_06216 [Caballeronia arationis]SOE57343.1 hypothetical protein SAMN05446927_1425 [Caballeronia arationis]
MRSSAPHHRSVAPVRVAQCLIVLFAVGSAASVIAQSSRDMIGAARLGSGYSQILSLTATPDISSAHLDVSDGAVPQSFTVTRIPYEGSLLTFSDRNSIGWRVSGGYFREKDEFPVSGPNGAAGSIASKWSAFSATGGLFLKSKLGYGFTFEPGLDLSVARLLNDALYAGAATSLKPVTDGPLFNWHENAWLITPNAALEWTTSMAPAQTLTIRGHIAWSWVSSFDESDPLLRFRETAGSWSIRSAYSAPTGAQLFARSLNYVVNAGYGGFFGPNRGALGFSTLANIGGGFELPLSRENTQSKRLRAGAAYLFGPHVNGWTVSVGLRY